MTDSTNTEELNPVPMGRTLEIVEVVNTGLYGLRFKEGGTLPKELDGAMWTTPQAAQKEIDKYVDAFRRKAEKVKKKGS